MSEPITPHEARHCAISYFIAAGLDWKQISTWAGHGDVRQTWNRYGHLVPGGEEQARERLDAYLTPPQPVSTVAHAPQNDETPENSGVLKYRYRDSNCVANTVVPVFTRDSGLISPAGGRWGRPETGHGAPSFAPSLGARFKPRPATVEVRMVPRLMGRQPLPRSARASIQLACGGPGVGLGPPLTLAQSSWPESSLACSGVGGDAMKAERSWLALHVSCRVRYR
jgi:hypothetical protein